MCWVNALVSKFKAVQEVAWSTPNALRDCDPASEHNAISISTPLLLSFVETRLWPFLSQPGSRSKQAEAGKVIRNGTTRRTKKLTSGPNSVDNLFEVPVESETVGAGTGAGGTGAWGTEAGRAAGPDRTGTTVGTTVAVESSEGLSKGLE